jgi:hypothetical protein
MHLEKRRVEAILVLDIVFKALATGSFEAKRMFEKSLMSEQGG